MRKAQEAQRGQKARDADVLILGGGIAGLSTAWHLARAGHTGVVLLEREPAFGRVSSGLNAAILRTLGTDPVTNELTRRGARFLRRPPAGFAPHPLVEACGLLLLASGDRAAELRRAATGTGRSVSAAEARRLAPHVAHAADLRLFFPSDGRIDVAALVDGFARGARRAGVELRPGTAARRLVVERGRVAGVELEDGSTLRARVTVLAAGGWAGRLGADAGSRVELRPTRRHLLVTAADAAPGIAIDPRWPVVWFESAGFYCRPESGGMLLCACDVEDVAPDRCFPDPDVRATIAAKAQRLLAGFGEARAAHFWCGLRTLTADDRFAIGFDPEVEGLFWVAGLGGHGMGCGPEVGRIAAALLAGEESDDPLARALEPGRLATSAV